MGPAVPRLPPLCGTERHRHQDRGCRGRRSSARGGRSFARWGWPASVSGSIRPGGVDPGSASHRSEPPLRSELALDLWTTEIHEARILASMVDDPSQVARRQMDAWAAGSIRGTSVTRSAATSSGRRPKLTRLRARGPQPRGVRGGGRRSPSSPHTPHDRESRRRLLLAWLPRIRPSGDRRAQRREEGSQLVPPSDRQTEPRPPDTAAIVEAEALLGSDSRSARWIARRRAARTQ